MNSLTSIIFKNEKRRERISREGVSGNLLSLLSFAIVFGSLAAIMIYVSVDITKRLEDIGQTYAFVNIMLLVNFGILFLGSIFQSLNVLYFSKDLKILLRMPIKSRDIVNAKILKMIVSEYEMEVIMLAIPMIVYGIMTNAGYQFYLYIPMILLILPIIPISVTSILLAVIMRFTNKIKNKSRVMYITIIIAYLLLNLVLSSVSGQGSILALFQNWDMKADNALATEIANQFKLLIPIMNSLLHYQTWEGVRSFILYLVASGISYVLAITTISSIYLKGAIGTTVNGNKKMAREKAELRIEDFKERPYQKAYLLKEYTVTRRSPVFFMQCIVFPFAFAFGALAIALAVVAFARGFEFDIWEEIKKTLGDSILAGAFLAVTQVFYMINFSSIIAVSKEKRWAVLSKCIPIKLSRQLHMKLWIGKLSSFISSLAVVIFYYLCTRSIWNAIFLVVASFGLNVFGEKIKILIDLRNPKIDWDNEYTMLKQNTNVMYELFYTMLVIAVVLLFGVAVPNVTIYFIVMIFMVAIINGIINQYIYRNDKKIFENLY